MISSGSMPKVQTMGMKKPKKEKSKKMHSESREAHHAMHEKKHGKDCY